MHSSSPFYLQKGNIYAVPIIHYNMEMAAQVRLAFEEVKPDCVAVELAETMQLRLIHAASRLPDISVVIAYNQHHDPLYYLCEPCDGTFEALRSALENQLPAHCIDLDVDDYPHVREHFPDPYAIQKIGLKNYYESYLKMIQTQKVIPSQIDKNREIYMAQRLKELSLSHDRVFFVGGMYHIHQIFKSIDMLHFPPYQHAARELVEICTLSEGSCREVLAECGWFSTQYEEWRESAITERPLLDRHQLIYHLYKRAAIQYGEETGNAFPGYNLRNIMKFVRNYALLSNRLMPDLYQILTAAKGCVDHNYAYFVWELATEYPYRKNIDALAPLDLSVDDVWKHSKLLRFHLKEKGRKGSLFQQRHKDRSQFRFSPPGPFSICSYPPEDLIVERFGNFLKKKGTLILSEETGRTLPFSTSLEDGIDARETLRHIHEKKIYIKVNGKPPGGIGSVVVIFDEDKADEGKTYHEKYSWKTTWLGEHSQESDMAFYATPLANNVVGPGISRCEYGGFMMSYPPRRMYDVWSDPDYEECRNKSETLLMAAIDYAVKPVVVYMAASPPRSMLKSFAKRFGKKIVYIPIGQISPILLNKIRAFHVLDGHDKREIADEYIF